MLTETTMEKKEGLDQPRTAYEIAESWLNAFEHAWREGEREQLESLFLEESHWRDLLAFTWTITPHDGRQSVIDSLLTHAPRVNARNFQIDEKRTPPRQVRRTGESVIEAIFRFETDHARCHGVLRLPVERPEKAWVFSSSVTELKGHEEPILDRRPTGAAFSRNFGGKNWSDLRAAEQDLHEHGANVRMIQRGSTTVVSVKAAGFNNTVHYEENIPLEDAELPPMSEAVSAIRDDFVRRRGYWTPMRDTIGYLMPDYFKHFINVCMTPWENGSLEPLERELLYIAIDTSVTHTYEPGIRMHIQNALRYGATRGQILEVFQLAALLGTEGYVLAMRELAGRPAQNDSVRA